MFSVTVSSHTDYVTEKGWESVDSLIQMPIVESESKSVTMSINIHVYTTHTMLLKSPFITAYKVKL